MTFFVCKGCFRFVLQWLFFVYTSKKVPKTQRGQEDLAKKKLKKQLIDSIIDNIIETEELNEKTDKAEKPEDAVAIIKQYEDYSDK